MSYEVITEQHSANQSDFVTNYVDSPAAIAIKKLIDISSRCLKAGNTKLHFCDSVIPIIGLVVGLIGIMLQAYSTVKDKGKPAWLKALALCVLGATATLAIAVFVLSVQCPPIALSLSFAAIGVGIALQVVDFFYSLASLAVAAFKSYYPSNTDNSAKIAALNSKRAMLFKQQTSLIAQLDEECDEKLAKKQHAALIAIQKKIIKTEKRIEQLKNPKAHANKIYKKKVSSFFGACLGLSICFGSSLIAIIGLTLAVGNPPLGLALIGLGLVFDTIILGRKVNKWIKQRAKARKNKNKFKVQSQALANESIDYLNIEQEQVQHSFNHVLAELKCSHIARQNDGSDIRKAIAGNREVIPVKNKPVTQSLFFDAPCAVNDETLTSAPLSL